LNTGARKIKAIVFVCSYEDLNQKGWLAFREVAARIGKILKSPNNAENVILVISQGNPSLSVDDVKIHLKNFTEELKSEMKSLLRTSLPYRDKKYACTAIEAILENNNIIIGDVLSQDAREMIDNGLQRLKSKSLTEFDFSPPDEVMIRDLCIIMGQVANAYDALRKELSARKKKFDNQRSLVEEKQKELEAYKRELSDLEGHSIESKRADIETCIRYAKQEIFEMEASIRQNIEKIKTIEQDITPCEMYKNEVKKEQKIAQDELEPQEADQLSVLESLGMTIGVYGISEARSKILAKNKEIGEDLKKIMLERRVEKDAAIEIRRITLLDHVRIKDKIMYQSNKKSISNFEIQCEHCSVLVGEWVEQEFKPFARGQEEPRYIQMAKEGRLHLRILGEGNGYEGTVGYKYAVYGFTCQQEYSLRQIEELRLENAKLLKEIEKEEAVKARRERTLEEEAGRRLKYDELRPTFEKNNFEFGGLQKRLAKLKLEYENKRREFDVNRGSFSSMVNLEMLLGLKMDEKTREIFLKMQAHLTPDRSVKCRAEDDVKSDAESWMYDQVHVSQSRVPASASPFRGAKRKPEDPPVLAPQVPVMSFSPEADNAKRHKIGHNSSSSFSQSNSLERGRSLSNK
jgi:hypothetical protein